MNESDFTRTLRRARREGFLDLRRFCDSQARGEIHYVVSQETIQDLIRRHRQTCEIHELPCIDLTRTRTKAFLAIQVETPHTIERDYEALGPFSTRVHDTMREFLLKQAELMGVYLLKTGIIADSGAFRAGEKKETHELPAQAGIG
jgi:hypothetical protein